MTAIICEKVSPEQTEDYKTGKACLGQFIFVAVGSAKWAGRMHATISAKHNTREKPDFLHFFCFFLKDNRRVSIFLRLRVCSHF